MYSNVKSQHESMSLTTNTKSIRAIRKWEIPNSEVERLDKVTAKNLFNQIKHILVINELNVAPTYLFFGILFLLHFKHMLQVRN
jgi:hypothetical protein